VAAQRNSPSGVAVLSNFDADLCGHTDVQNFERNGVCMGSPPPPSPRPLLRVAHLVNAYAAVNLEHDCQEFEEDNTGRVPTRRRRAQCIKSEPRIAAASVSPRTDDVSS
jgi:hypothetical protein